MNVVHNRLARRAFADIGAPKEFQALLKGPVAILVGEDGAIAASRCITQWRKKNKDIGAIRGGLFQGKAIQPTEVEKLATMPDKDTLRGRTATLLLAPAMTLANATQSLLTHLVSSTKAYREAKDTAEGGETAAGGNAS
jgi:large subunit ribosomal protein L10